VVGSVHARLEDDSRLVSVEPTASATDITNNNVHTKTTTNTSDYYATSTSTTTTTTTFTPVHDYCNY